MLFRSLTNRAEIIPTDVIITKSGYFVSGATPKIVDIEIAKPSVDPSDSVFTTIPKRTIEMAVFNIAKKMSL